MVKKSSLAKKLASYSAMAAAILVADKNADAQIVYTQLSPFDTVGTNYETDYKLDLNNDGIYDFDIKAVADTGVLTYYHFLATYYRIMCIANSQNEIVDTIYGFAKPFNIGDTISAKKKSWDNEGLLGSVKCIFNLCFPDVIDTTEYIGLKILKNGSGYYGWARVEIDYQATRVPNYSGFFAVIEDYAYNTIPDSAIYAGEICSPNYLQPSLQVKNDTLSTNVTTHIQWTFNDKPIAGDTTQTMTLSQYGLYQVREGDTTQCYTESPTYNYINCSAYKPSINSPIACVLTEKDLNIDTIPIDYSVQWFRNDTLLSGQNNQSLQIINPVPATYFAVLYEQQGCYDTTSQINLIIDSIYLLTTIKQHIDTLFAESKNDHFFSNVIYYWLDSTGEVITGAINYYYIIPVNGYYSVSVTDSDSCRGFGGGYYFVTGINTINPANIFIAESNNLLSIKFNEEPYNGYKLVIYNYIGQQVYTTEITSGDMMINLSSLAKGFYLVTLEKENRRVVKKIVLQ